ILKAGGAYVPLDPAYPPPRLAQILTDAGVRVVVTLAALAVSLPEGLSLVRLDADAGALAQESDARPESGVTARDLVYVLFTSGPRGATEGWAPGPPATPSPRAGGGPPPPRPPGARPPAPPPRPPPTAAPRSCPRRCASGARSTSSPRRSPATRPGSRPT